MLQLELLFCDPQINYKKRLDPEQLTEQFPRTLRLVQYTDSTGTQFTELAERTRRLSELQARLVKTCTIIPADELGKTRILLQDVSEDGQNFGDASEFLLDQSTYINEEDGTEQPCFTYEEPGIRLRLRLVH